MNIKSFTFNPFQTNCYVVDDAGEAVIVDPGCYEAWEVTQLVSYLEEKQLRVRHILLTHAHLDHIFGCEAVTRHFGVGYWMHPADAPLLMQAPMHAEMFGLSMDAEPPPPAGYLQEEDTVNFGETSWRVLHTPGHSPGSVCFYDDRHHCLVSGDVLFYDSIGRTDLWQGSLPILMESIFQKLMPLRDNVRLYPGHGPASTIGRERRENPFLQN